MLKIQKVSIKPAPMSTELVKRLYDAMTEAGKDEFLTGFHPDDHATVRQLINRPVGWFIPHNTHENKYVKFVGYNPDPADRASRRDYYIPVWTEVECQEDQWMSIAVMNRILREA